MPPSSQPAFLPLPLMQWSWLLLTLLFVRRIHDTIVVFGELVVALGADAIAGRRRIACQREILFDDLLCVAADLDVRTVALE